MNTTKHFFNMIVLTSALAFSQSAIAAAHSKMAEMKLDNALSSLSFISIKKGTAAEAHHIRTLSGSISAKGELKVDIHFDSVDSKIAIRDTRMKEHLFRTSGNPIASITANVGSQLPASGVVKVMGEGNLTMMGVSNKIAVNVVVANTGDQLVISSATPIIIKAADYGMEEGVKKLQELAKLPSVATAVPVSFVLTFSK